MKAFGQSIEQAWAEGSAELAAAEKQEKARTEPGDLLPLYRYINRMDHLRILADVNSGAAMQGSAPPHYPQMWVAVWEVRSLRIVANTRAAFREQPGTRVLSIVGVSHNQWFDS